MLRYNCGYARMLLVCPQDEDDVGYGKRLRWVKLSELLENVGDDDLAKLRAWEKDLNPAMKQERKRLREEDE